MATIRKTSAATLKNSIIHKIEASNSTGILTLRSEGLVSVPAAVYDRELRATQIGGNWWEAADLVQIVLAHNEISELPEEISKCQNLKLLDISYNEIESLPTAICSILELKNLDVSHNKLKSLPESMSNLRSLNVLSVADNNIKELPFNFGENLLSLNKFDISQNAITQIPNNLSHSESLSVLNLENNKIENIGVILSLKSLVELNLSHNIIKTIPTEIGNLKNLKIFNIRYNQITMLPKDIGNCQNLIEFHGAFNKINKIPEEIGQLSELKVLDLNTNYLRTFPGTACKKLKLTYFDLSNNDLSTLPPELGLMTSLRRMPLEGNPLRTIRRELVTGPVKALLESLRKKLPDDEGNEVSDFRNGHRSSGGGSGFFTGTGSEFIKGHLKRLAVSNTLGELNCSSMQLTSFLPEISEHIQFITKLDISQNKINEVKSEVFEKAENLKFLAMSECSLSQWPLPPIQGCLPNLIQLNLSKNKISNIPSDAFISCAQNLQELDLTGVLSVRKMPEGTLSILGNLKRITLVSCGLQEIPSDLLNPSLTALASIDLNQNSLTSIPIQITQLSKLEELNLSNNSLSDIPLEIGLMTGLKSLMLEGNMLRKIRRTVLVKGTAAILEYLRSKIPS